MDVLTRLALLCTYKACLQISIVGLDQIKASERGARLPFTCYNSRNDPSFSISMNI